MPLATLKERGWNGKRKVAGDSMEGKGREETGEREAQQNPTSTTLGQQRRAE